MVAVIDAARRRAYTKGEIVFHEGDPADGVHLVISGHLAVRVTTPEGEQAILNVVGRGGHVGELALLPSRTPQTRSATVVALDDVVTRALTAAAFHDLCDRVPGVQAIVLELLADRVRELSDRLVEATYVGLDRRLYRTLLRLHELYSSPGQQTVIPFTQEQLGEMVGGTRPSVNQVLQRLVDQHVIELGRGRVMINDLPALVRKAGTR